MDRIVEGFIDVPGGKVWYRITGADQPGIPLLVLHGGPGAPHDYLEPLEALAVDRPVVFYDQLGCGKSDRPSDTSLWTVARFALELAEVRLALKLDTVHILAQPWGTMLAVDYLLEMKPRGVVSLVLSGPCLSVPRWMADQQMWIDALPPAVRDTIRKYEASGDFSAQGYQDAMMVFYRKHVCMLDPWPDCINRTFQNFGWGVYSHMWGPSEFTTTGTLLGYDRTPRLREITLPVLFTCGEFDEATPATTGYCHSLMPGSEIHVFQGASHNHHLEKPEEYMGVTRDFLTRNENFLNFAR